MSARVLGRARRLLAMPDAWLDATPGGYALRVGKSRRTRPMLSIDETAFEQLIADPGLRARKGGGWVAREAVIAAPALPPGRPGVIEGVRIVAEPDGRLRPRRANLARSPIAWLAGRTDAEGRSWLEPVEVAAAERLGLEAEAAMKGPSLTMRWDALPRSGSGGSAFRAGPTGRVLAAGARVEAALAACGPARRMVEHVCIRATALQAAEQDLGLRRRTGKALLKQGLQALAGHYGLAGGQGTAS
ncbi:DUF6456 domain-containing protein [Brevundimonas lenta]|uniref:DUF6456 domain-containing protein n=1 Tax=Brevundimonas lenta TaxID=424796 RepID=A0A7W6JFB0_9CAUL|nr:DUF6456 domain-containing protein [Brevundimonas lenta]MBB4084036.1 hypothetical protein [Brevundimonas lenta]